MPIVDLGEVGDGSDNLGRMRSVPLPVMISGIRCGKESLRPYWSCRACRGGQFSVLYPTYRKEEVSLSTDISYSPTEICMYRSYSPVLVLTYQKKAVKQQHPTPPKERRFRSAFISALVFLCRPCPGFTRPRASIFIYFWKPSQQHLCQDTITARPPSIYNGD